MFFLGKNIENNDSIIRFIIATILLTLSIISKNYYVFAFSIILYLSAYTKFCLLYYFLNINNTKRNGSLLLSKLPIHNISSVFIFNNQGVISFKNKSADIYFKHIEKISDFGDINVIKIIDNSLDEPLIYKFDNKTYQIDIKGSLEEKSIFAYTTDITEVINLNEEIEATQREIIFTMGEIGETRSKETGLHVKRVAYYSALLAKLYGLNEEESENIRIASPMHDIGKIGIPDNILNKPGKLTPDEFEVMKTHSELGYKMLKQSERKVLKLSATIAYEHHEKYDGSGYPRGISGENISIYARITAIADVFDALGSDRVYKKAWELNTILDFFEKERAKHFDPELVDLFFNNLDKFLEIRDKYKDKTDA